MQSVSKLLKEVNDLDTSILNNRIAQYKQLLRLSAMPVNNQYTYDNKMDVYEKIADLEREIMQQLKDRERMKPNPMFSNDREVIDKRIKNEFIRMRAERESIDRYTHMKLKDLLSVKNGKGSQ